MIRQERWGLIGLVVLSAGGAFAAPLSSGVKVDALSVTVPEGEWVVNGRSLEIKKGGRFFVRSDTRQMVVDEPLQLSPDKPAGFWTGTKLQGPRAAGPINAINSLCEETLVLRREKGGGAELRLGKDYLVSPPFALLGLGPETNLTEKDVVYASYQYRVHRLDSVILNPDGSAEYVQGRAGVAEITPPAISPESIRLLNVYRPYDAKELKPEHLFFVDADQAGVRTGTTVGRIPKTLRKLENGEAVTIVCLGDSVTVGADIPNPADTYVERFRAQLQARFSPQQINLHNLSLGGSKSIQWLHDGNYERLQKRPADICSFARVLAAKPDLVTIEFVNDTELTAQELEWSYGKIADELQAIGTEVILITPHFTHQRAMKTDEGNLRPAEQRPYVAFLREFAERRNLGLADAAARWEQSWKEGIPYMTLLANHYNHPTAAGGNFFVEELMKCFQGKGE